MVLTSRNLPVGAVFRSHRVKNAVYLHGAAVESTIRHCGRSSGWKFELYSSSVSSDCFCLEHGEETIAKSLLPCTATPRISQSEASRRERAEPGANGRWARGRVMQHTPWLTSRSTNRSARFSVGFVYVIWARWNEFIQAWLHLWRHLITTNYQQ